MTGITNIVRDFVDQPNIVRILSTDTMATIAASNYILNQKANIEALNLGDFQWLASDVILVSGADGWNFFTISTDYNSLVAFAFTGAPLIVSDTTSSATPGTIRAVLGKMTNTATVMTSGNLVGVRGEVDYVGASGGFVYGTQGKIIPTGTISGSSWNAGVFGQLDIHAATINAGQMATLWGDYGTTSGTLTDQTGLYGIAMTNTTAAVLEGQVYLYGGAQNLLLLNTNAGLSGTTYYLAAGTGSGSAGNSTHCAAQQVLKISVNGATCYIPVFTQNS